MLFFPSSSTHSIQKENQKNPTQIKIAAWNVEYGECGSAAEIGLALKQFDFDVDCSSEAPGRNRTKDAATAMGMKYFVVGKYSTALHENKHKTIASKTTLYDFEEVLMANTLHTATKAKTKLIDTGISIYAVHIPVGWRNQTHIDKTTNKTAIFIEYLKSNQKEEIAIVAAISILFHRIPTPQVCITKCL